MVYSKNLTSPPAAVGEEEKLQKEPDPASFRYLRREKKSKRTIAQGGGDKDFNPI